MSDRQRPSKHFLQRERDGSVRLRLRFDGEQASNFEEAAGRTPILEWIHHALDEAALRDIAAARAERDVVPPPDD